MTVMKFKTKKGSAAIFLLMILSAVLLATGIMIKAAVSASERSYADATFQLACRSILSEYDVMLLSEYGLYGFRGEEGELEEKLRFYCQTSFAPGSRAARSLGSGRRERINILKLKGNDMHVRLKGYALTDLNIFESQITDNGYRLASELSKKHEMRAAGTAENDELRTIKNEAIIKSLPSGGVSGIGVNIEDIIQGGNGTGSIIDGAGKQMLTMSYIFNRFSHHNNYLCRKEEHFFKNEVEYILAGKMSDAENYEQVKNTLFLMRTGLNTAHILADQGKMSKVTAVSSAASAAAPLAEALIIACWAAAEAENDIKLLAQGEPVPITKCAENWALDLDGIVDMIKAGMTEGFTGKRAAIRPSALSGQYYDDYLRLLLSFQNRERKLLRIMDLVQIHMKTSYDETFLLKEYFAGFHMRAFEKGEEYAYNQRYYDYEKGIL